MSSSEGKLDFKNLKAYVKNVKINGLKRTREEYVLAQLNDIFGSINFEDVLSRTDEFRRRVIALGCFKSVEALIDNTAGSTDRRSFNVSIDVEELGTVGGGVHSNFGSNDGSLSTSVNFPNVFGGGEKLSAEYTYGTRNHVDYRLNYSSPMNLDPKKQFSFASFRTENDFSWSKFKETHNGITFDIMRPYSRSFLGDQYELKGTHVFSYEGVWRHMTSALDASFDVRSQSGHSLKSSVKYTNIIDRRDSPTLPTKGGYLKASAEVAGLGGDVRFLKVNSDYQFTRTFFDYFTTQFTVSNGFVTPLKTESENETPLIRINDKFFVGGPLTMRGFAQRGLGPRSEECSMGNDAYWLCGAHLYTPLPFLHKNKSIGSWLKTHSFVNAGNLMSLDKFFCNNENKLKYQLENARLTVGSGVVMAFGQMARLELNYVWPICKHNSDKATEGLQFGIGVSFN